MRHSLRLSGVIAVLVTVPWVLTLAAPVVSKELAASCVKKIETITKVPGAGQPARRTPLSEGELNSWLTFSAVDRIPA